MNIPASGKKGNNGTLKESISLFSGCFHNANMLIMKKVHNIVKMAIINGSLVLFANLIVAQIATMNITIRKID